MLVKVLTWVLALVFVAGGIPKLVGLDSVAAEFVRFGYSTAFRLLIGVLEVTGGLMLLVPRLALYGAGVLLVIMVGAAWTLVRVGDAPTPPIVVGALLLVLLTIRPRPAA
jgi:uncharacterized membrane protein YphA (DoxX/SURF4 family)